MRASRLRQNLGAGGLQRRGVWIRGSSPGTCGPPAKSFTYDAIRNITSKSDTGT